MKDLIDTQGLFNCLRPDPNLSGAFDPEEVEVFDCTVCYQKATRKVKYLTPLTGIVAALYVCDECYADDELWKERQIIMTTHL